MILQSVHRYLICVVVSFFLFSFGARIQPIHAATFTWNTFLGGGGSDQGWSISLDSSNNIYIAGFSSATWGAPIRTYTENSDAFVAKLSSSGSLLWNTFLGGSGSDYGIALTVDSSGNVHVGGYSDATWGAPIRTYTENSDAFVAKLSSSGSLLWNTFLGGNGNDYGQGISVDSFGNTYVAGYGDATWGSPVRVYTNADVFAAKLNSSGELVWNTFLGGSGLDAGGAIFADASGNAFVAGYSNATWESPVRAYTASDDVFAAKLNVLGELVWNTFLGGDRTDRGYGISMDSLGNAYVTGYSQDTWGSPIREYTGNRDAFAAKLDSSGALLWNTFVGGSGDDYGQSISVDSSGNVYMAGYGDATWGTPVRAYTAGDDAFAVKFDFSGELSWNAFLGGSGSDTGTAISLDSSGNVYVGGYSNATWGAPVRAYTSGYDAFVAKIADGTPAVSITPETHYKTHEHLSLDRWDATI